MNTPENDKSKEIERHFGAGGHMEELCHDFKKIDINRPVPSNVQKDLVCNVLFVLLLAWGFVEKQKF